MEFDAFVTDQIPVHKIFFKKVTQLQTVQMLLFYRASNLFNNLYSKLEYYKSQSQSLSHPTLAII